MTEKEVKALFEAMTPSQAQKDAMWTQITQPQPTKKQSFSVKRCIAIVAVVLTLFTATAFGYRASTIQTYTTEVYHWSASELARNIQISDTDAGLTLTAESVCGDNENVYVLFSISDKVYHTLSYGDLHVDFDQNDFSGSYDLFLLDQAEQKPTDKTKDKTYFVAYVETYRGTEEIQNIGQTMKIKIHGLYGGRLGDALGLRKENKGVWEFEIPLEYEAYGYDSVVHTPFTYTGNTVYLESIHYAPLDVSIRLKSEEGYLEHFIENYAIDGTVGIALETKQGRIYPRTSSGDNAGTDCYFPFSMREIGMLAPEDVIGVYYYEKGENGEMIQEMVIPVSLPAQMPQDT